MHAWLSSSLCLFAIVLGCGDDGRTTPPGDSGMGDAATGPADIPWLGAGAPPLNESPERACPTGFREARTDTGILTCRAYPETGPEACPSGSAHFPGGAGCETVGTACPTDGWPTDLPAGRTVVYVRAGAVGGRGSMSSPHGTITRAIERAPSGAVIAVAPGVYNEQVQLDDDLAVVGACPAETILTLDLVSETSVVAGTFVPGSFGLENLTIRGDGSMGIYVQGGATMRVANVVIDNAAGFGLYAVDAGTTVDIERTIIQNVERFPSGIGGIGVQYIEGAAGTLSYVASVNNADGHLFVAEGGSATITRFAGLGTEGGGPGERSGAALVVQDRSSAELTASALWGNEGGGILTALGATLMAREIEVVDSGAEGLLSISPSLEVRVDSVVTVDGGHFETARTGNVVLSENGDLTVRDGVIRETRPDLEDDPSGLGVSLEAQGVLRLERVLMEDVIRTGIVAMPQTTLSLVDVTIRRIAAAGGRNLGLAVSAFGAATFERVVIEEATLLGVAASGDSAVMSLVDVLVRGTRSDPDEGFYGRGLEANLGAQLTGDRVVLENNREVGMTAYDTGTRVMLQNFVLRGTLPAECGEGCGGNAAGYGATIQNGASVELSGFLVDDNTVLGVQVGPGSGFSGARGEVAGSPIGLNIQNPDFDLATALSDVAFRDLERNVDAEMLPLPPPGL